MTDNNRCAHQWSTSTCLNSEKWTNRLKFIYQQEVKKKRPDTDTKTKTNTYSVSEQKDKNRHGPQNSLGQKKL